MIDAEEHTGQHLDCPPCFKIKCEGIQFAGASVRAIEVRQRDRRFNKDAAAYRRLRKEGLQPAHVGGSAIFEAKADHAREIERGKLLRPEIKRILRQREAPQA